MKSQFDHKERVVSLENLTAMCEQVSSVCHRYWIESVSSNRVKVGYSNPDEWGSNHPMIAIFPAYPSAFDKNDNPCVVLDILDVKYDNWDGEGWQAFQSLLDCPVLWRNPVTEEWQEEKKA